MRIKTGVDILKADRFRESFGRSADAFSKRVFTQQELRQNTAEQLASIFCLKEALLKALELPKDSWLLISTNRKKDGKVDVSFTNSEITRKIISYDTSLSHDGGFIIAVAVLLLRIR